MAEKLTNEEIRDWVLNCVTESEDASNRKRDLGAESWRLYFNEYDFSRKEDWQTKIPVPLWAMGVDQAKSALAGPLKKATRMFSVEVGNPNDPLEVAKAHLTHDLLYELLRQANAAVAMGDGIHVALLTNIMAFKAKVVSDEKERYAPVFRDIPMEGKFNEDGSQVMETILGRQVVTERKMRLDIPVINPRHLYLDPRNRNLYRAQRALRDLAILDDSDIRKSLRAEAVRNALAEEGSGARPEDEEEQRDVQHTIGSGGYRRQLDWLEYYGPIYNKKGRMVYKNKWVVLLNRKDVALMEPYPWWHGEDPFSVTNLIRVPFTPFGKLLIQHVGPIGKAVTEVLCMLGDAQKFGVLSAFGVDTSLLENVEELADGIFPGITLSTLGPNPIQQLKFGGINASDLQLYNELLQRHQNDMAVTEFLSGSPSIRGRATATEVNTKTQMSTAFFEGLAGDIEDFGFEPLIEKCWWNMLQFFEDWDQPMMRAIAAKHGMTPEMMGTNAVERYTLLHGAYKFHVVGLSAVLRRAEMMEKMMRLLEVIKNAPELFVPMTNMQKLYERVLESFEFEDLIQQANAIPPVVAPAGAAPTNAAPVGPNMPGMVGMPSPQNLGELLKTGRGR